MSESSELLDQVKKALHAGNEKLMEDIAYEVLTKVLEFGAFPESYFDALLSTLEDVGFLSAMGSWHLVKTFEENWEEMSEKQKATLLPALEASYERFADWMSCFVISGILGECYADERALSTLSRLMSCRREIPRSLIPHGLEHIALEAVDRRLATRAYQELTRMSADDSEVVRNEVNGSLSKIKRRANTIEWEAGGPSGGRNERNR